MKAIFLLFSSVLCFSAQADLSHPLFLSQGGAGGASLKEDFSHLINPATMAFQKRTKAAVSYSFAKDNKTALFSVADMKVKVPLSVTYQRDWSHSLKKSDRDKLSVGSGFKILPYLSLGVSVEKDLKKGGWHSWNGGAGSLLRLNSQLSTALFLTNILRANNKNRRSLSLAVYHNWENFFSTKIDVSMTAHQKWVLPGRFGKPISKFFLCPVRGSLDSQKPEMACVGRIEFSKPKVYA